MSLLKHQYIRSKALTQSAAGQPCVRCGSADGTVVAAHYTGLRQHAYGKGRGIKCDDTVSAELCQACHQWFDAPAQRKSIEASEEFLHCVVLTNRHRYDRGLISVKGAKS